MKRVLKYNEQKIQKGFAELLMASGYPKDLDLLSFNDKLNRFRILTELNTRVKTNTLHISLNFDPREQLTNEMLELISFTYMQKIGFGEQPFLVYRHFDAAHPHVHILSTNIQSNGKRIDLYNIGRNQSENARKEIELAFDLIKAEDQKQNEAHLLKRTSLQAVQYGKSETKRAISNIVGQVMTRYNYTSLAEFNAALGQFGVLADRGHINSQMFQKKGLLYRIINEKGEKLGIPIKASSIYGKPTLETLEKRFQQNEPTRKIYKKALQNAIDKILETGALDRNAFSHLLQKEQIRVLYRKNEEGLLYEITFIDNARHSVFNGSELGMMYSAKALTERFATTAQTNESLSIQQVSKQQKDFPTHLDKCFSKDNIIPNHRASFPEILLTNQSSIEGISEFAKPKRKRKKKSLSV